MVNSDSLCFHIRINFLDTFDLAQNSGACLRTPIAGPGIRKAKVVSELQKGRRTAELELTFLRQTSFGPCFGYELNSTNVSRGYDFLQGSTPGVRVNQLPEVERLRVRLLRYT